MTLSDGLSIPGLVLCLALAPLPAAGAMAGTAEPLPALPPGVLADLDPEVAAQLEAQRAAADQAIAAGRPAADRARLSGELGGLYLLYGLYGPAQEALAQAELLAPTEFRWPYLLGFARQTVGDLDAAVAAYERALRLAPGHQASLLRLGELRLTQGENEAAAELFQRALEAGDECAACHFGLGRAAATRGEAAAAVRHFERALELEPEATAIRPSLAQAYRQLGRLELARREIETVQGATLREVVIPDPLFAWLRSLATGSAVYVQRGQRALAAGQPELAEREFRQAVGLNPESARARRALGLALRRLGRLDEAIEEYREALRLAPATALNHQDLALALTDAGLLSQAERRFLAAIELQPEFAQAELGLGIVLGRLGRLDEALAHLERALELEPTSAAARFEKAMIELRSGRVDDARAGLEALLELDAGHHPARLNLGLLHESAGRHELAEVELRRLLERRPHSRLAAAGRLALGRLAERRGDLAGARQEYVAALELDAGLVAARLRLASVSAASGDLAAAADAYRRALEAAPEHRAARLSGASALLLAGREREAVALLDEGLERTASDPLLLAALALVAATARDATVRDAARALQLARQAYAALPSPLNAQVLAFASFESGRPEEALEALERTLAKLEVDAPESLALAARARLESLRAGQPLRAPWLDDPTLIFPAALPLQQALGE